MSRLPQAPASADTRPAANPPRRIHSVEKKRSIVEETLQPHASVARVARVHGVNATPVFCWRKPYQQGLLEAATPTPALLPVPIADLVPQAARPTPTAASEVPIAFPHRGETAPTGTLHLKLAQAELRIEGAADPSCLQAVLAHRLG